MTLDTINIGSTANDGTGDDLRAAFTKVNAAIAEINDGVNVVTLEMFGADGTAAGDTAAWSSAMTNIAANGGKLTLGPRAYLFNAEIEMADGLVLEGVPGSVLDFSGKAAWSSGTADALMEARGTREETGRTITGALRRKVFLKVDTATRSGTTVTLTTDLDHGLTTGEVVHISGSTTGTATAQRVFYTLGAASTKAYDEPVTITVTGAKTFTYTVADTGDTTLSGIAYVEAGTGVTVSDTAGLAAGDMVFIESDAVRTDGSGGNYKIGELNYVKHVFDGTKMEMRSAVRDTYLASDSAKIFKVTPKRNIHLSGFKIKGKGPNTASGFGDRGIILEYVENLSISNVEVEGVDQMGMLLWSCANGDVASNVVRFDASDEGGRTSGAADIQYGIAFGAGTQALRITSNTIYGSRHGIVESTSPTRSGIARDIVISQNNIYGSWLAGISTHQSIEDCIVTNNVLRGCETGVDLRYGDGSIICDNIFDRCQVAINLSKRVGGTKVYRNKMSGGLWGIRIDSALSTSDVIRGLEITDNEIIGFSLGVTTGLDDAGLLISDWVVDRNLFRDISEYPIRMNIGDSADADDGMSGSISGNRIIDLGAALATTRAIWVTNARKMRINDNSIRVGTGAAGAGVYLDGAGTQGCEIARNQFDGSFSVRDIQIAAGLGGHEAVRTFSRTFDATNIAGGAEVNFNITATGVPLGARIVEVGYTPAIGNLIVTARIEAADTITVSLFNPTGGAINPPEATYTVRVNG